MVCVYERGTMERLRLTWPMKFSEEPLFCCNLGAIEFLFMGKITVMKRTTPIMTAKIAMIAMVIMTLINVLSF